MSENRANSPEIIVSGVGVLSALGTDADAFFDVICPQGPDTSLPEYAIDADKPLVTALGIRDARLRVARYMDPVSKNAIITLKQVLSDAGLESESIQDDPYNYALVFGALRGPYATREKLYETFEKKQRRMVSGTLFSHCGYNMAAAMTAVAYGIKGPNLTFSAKPSLGDNLLRRANQLLRSGRVHTAFVGFSEMNEDVGLFKELGYLLCLENRTHALQRGVSQFVDIECTTDASASNFQLTEHLMPYRAYLPLIELGGFVNRLKREK
jgi:3-oxoacyl-[acyl-carrier-protein] synthase II